MALLADVTAKIRRRVPESADRWSDSTVYQHILLADMMVRENCELDWSYTDISLVAGAIYYSLPTDVIAVGAVLFSTDGTNFNKYELAPADFQDLDCLDNKWRDATRDRPTHYVLLGAPASAGSRILLWPKLSAPTTETVRVRYLHSLIAIDLSLTTTIVPGFIEDRVYVPLTLGLLYGTTDARTADSYVREAMDNMMAAKSRAMPYQDAKPVDPNISLSRMGGQVR